MMVVVTYDVDTSTLSGEKRLRKVAKICEAYGCRVQNSVFEIIADPGQYAMLKATLSKMIDVDKDSVRFYQMGSNWKPKIECIGKQLRFEQDDVIIL